MLKDLVVEQTEDVRCQIQAPNLPGGVLAVWDLCWVGSVGILHELGGRSDKQILYKSM